MVRYSNLKAQYEIEKTIGCGGFAKVKLATHLLTREKVAIKIMNKSGLGDDLPRVRQELEALKRLSHHHICKLYEVIETDTHIFMVIEYCAGGELFDHIVERNRLTEAAARSFFRQIISAVAYLHEQGYAHRDLKPENILLDKNQNLKLIDFGLCAKPAGGLESHLLTSCGSPTYAAPELILGKQYLGSEVDIWSMGVLLYALLCGFLPFDDETIDSLYKKILSGRYHEPEWLSRNSKDLIKSMLQLDPKQRITIKELQNHPWVLTGYGEPVASESLIDFHEMDRTCVGIMAHYHGITWEEMWSSLSKWPYDYNTSTYLLLLAKKKRGSPVRLSRPTYRVKGCDDRLQGMEDSPVRIPKTANARLKETYVVVANEERTTEKLTAKSLRKKAANPDQAMCDGKENSSGFSEPVAPTPQRRAHKRYWSPGLQEPPSPVPKKMTPGSERESQDSTFHCNLHPGGGGGEAGEEAAAGSGGGSGSSNASTPCATTPRCARKVLGGLERSLQRVRHVLTPRRARDRDRDRPCLLAAKNVCNVSTMTYNDPERVRSELLRMLVDRGFDCKQKGWVVRAKQPRLSFELEVCLVAPSADAECVVAVRRKRLRGDAWSYKRVCEQVLALGDG
ncbi:maternal embryonic leucine zipper kinase-like [Schistocerca nitens]|uniref:maternal embryonic leucine zipper kinase-like n=1 Tax=Schistocerca nitens TaxID=7011 RepID=UPI0021198FB7|nr:maternal embryonic leucine zipper kinase-like [Schistocerca nitens]XP_049799099.1 maternal embryonic leucine zipper kinase-like [Schistocerca nitens]XP_049799104.1 maternal embryonic leucine zipper kinase-like [Schistocerca nitens]